MLIAVNTRFLIKDKLEGIGWFTYETMKRLTQNHPEHQFLFLFDREFDPGFIFSENIIPVNVWPPARHPYLWKYWYDFALPKVFKKYKPDLFISTDGMLSLKTHVPTLLVIHDLGFEHYPDHTPGVVSKYYRKFTPLYARKASRIVTVSKFSKNDIIKRYHIQANKIDVVHNGANEVYMPLPESEKVEVRKNISAGENYYIYVGSIHPRKNIKNLLIAYDTIRQKGITNNKLVIVGRAAWKVEETKLVYDNMLFKNDVIFTGHLQITDLSRVLASADALVFPSLFEGFGIPVIEARYCGIPVILSNRSSLPEVGGNDAIYFNPDSVEEIIHAMTKFIDHKEYYSRQALNTTHVKREFNWDQSAMDMYDSFTKCTEKNNLLKTELIAS